MSEPRQRRPRGDGGIYQKHREGCEQPKKKHSAGCSKPVKANGKPACRCESACDCAWWIAYAANGKRQHEYAGKRKSDAERLVRRRVGARDHNLPVIPRAERLTFDEAAKDCLNDYRANGKRSIDSAERRIDKHLAPYFAGRRLAGLTAADVRAYIAKRQKDVVTVQQERIVDGKALPAVTRPVANATINRELAALRRIFNLAIQSGRLAARPHIALLKEAAPRSGFFDESSVANVIARLPEPFGAVIRFAYLTAWRLHSEVLKLEWRQVDFGASEIRIAQGVTKGGEGRVFPLTVALRQLLEERKAAADAMRKAGHLVPWVFWRTSASGKPAKIGAFDYDAWREACAAAGRPGAIPHDLRRSGVRGFVRAGLSQNVAMRLSGHRTPAIFSRYDIVSEDDLRSAARALDARAEQAPPGNLRGNLQGKTR